MKNAKLANEKKQGRAAAAQNVVEKRDYKRVTNS